MQQTLPIEVISAGAGSGKTYTLTQRMVALLQQGVRPAGIMATTFTKKAAAELQERVRLKLLELGMKDAANELGEALIGTVHSIGTRLLQRFAFEAGVSPLVEIIADGDENRLFNESLSQVLDEKRIARMNELADRLGLTKKTMGDPFDWRRVIHEVTDVARANNFDHKTLKKSKKQSWESFEQLLPPVQETDPVVWNNRLISAIDQTVAALEANEADSTKVTRDGIETLRALQTQLRLRGELYWHEWVKIAKTNVSAKSRELMEDLQNLALSHDEHPQFRQDVRAYIELVFDIATDALQEYEQYKKKRGLIDYTDMETCVSKLLRVPHVRETLRESLDLLLVDEFQDTSPIQLDIFLQISRLARHSIWVGDPKQSIYGFRGAEPALMMAIIEACGGVRDENILKKSWRSRPDIVHACNAIFERAFDNMPRAQIVLEPAAAPDPGAPPALMHWHFRNELDEKRTPGGAWFDQCVAEQTAVLLERGLPVYNKKRSATRPLLPSDIAILCRNNRQCVSVAGALRKAGVKAAIAGNALLETAEAKLVVSCLKYLLTPSDALSAAEILLLTGSMSLQDIVETRLEEMDRARSAETAPQNWPEADMLLQLQSLRPRIADLSASEILNLMLEELDLRRVAVQLGNAGQRLDNIECLRRYALDYESACQRLHSAASLGGFLLWLDRLAEAGSDFQGSGETEDAVKVLTYHRSKGLEYPVAICHSLDQSLREQVWGVNLVNELDKPDLDNILGNRWLRFWVNPYADQLRNTRLEAALMETEAWHQARRTALEEEARLMYVGLTRARDYLVFPSTPKGTGWLNRVFNHGDETIPTLDPHSDETPFYHKDLPLSIHTEIVYQPKDFPEKAVIESEAPYHSARRGKAPQTRPLLLIDSAHEPPPGLNYQLSEPVAWGNWLEFKGDYQVNIGKALNAFLLADDPARAQAQRLRAAEKQLHIRGVQEQVAPVQLLQQSEALQRFLSRSFQPLSTATRYPIEALVPPAIRGRRLLRLEADLYLESPSGDVVLLFAPYAEGMKKWKNHAQNLAIPLGWWREIQRFREKPTRYWVVFTMEGMAVEVVSGHE